jgi:hypothetical protein
MTNEQIENLFSELSDWYWSAGWVIDLDVILWRLLQDPRSYLKPEHRAQLNQLVEENKWCWWPEELEEEEVIALDKWRDAKKVDFYYFGVWPGQKAGHFMHNIWGQHVHPALPWEVIDGVLQPGAEKKRHPHDFVPIEEQVEGLAHIHYKDGWTALSFWDRSGDSRGGSNSNFFFKGTYTFEQMVDLAKECFHTVWARFPFKVVVGAEVVDD